MGRGVDILHIVDGAAQGIVCLWKIGVAVIDFCVVVMVVEIGIGRWRRLMFFVG